MTRLSVHVAILHSQPETFWVTRERFAAACDRHRTLSQRLDTTFSENLDGFEDAITDTDILIGWRFPCEKLAAVATRLKWIQLTGAGCEHLQPLDWLAPGVSLTTNSGVHGPKAAEFAGTAILMLNNDVPFFSTGQRLGQWRKRFASVIDDKTVSIVGVGHMGGAVAQWVKRRLGVTVLGVRRSGRPHRYVDEMYRPSELDRVLPRTDFLVVTAPLTDETEGLIDRRALDLMKPSAALVNMGRARVVDYEGLRTKLERNELRGAVLDVFDPEPLPSNSPLWTTPNLSIIPHASSDDAEHYIDRTLDLFFDNLARFVDGRPLKNRVRKHRQY